MSTLVALALAAITPVVAISLASPAASVSPAPLVAGAELAGADASAPAAAAASATEAIDAEAKAKAEAGEEKEQKQEQQGPMLPNAFHASNYNTMDRSKLYEAVDGLFYRKLEVPGKARLQSSPDIDAINGYNMELPYVKKEQLNPYFSMPYSKSENAADERALLDDYYEKDIARNLNGILPQQQEFTKNPYGYAGKVQLYRVKPHLRPTKRGNNNASIQASLSGVESKGPRIPAQPTLKAGNAHAFTGLPGRDDSAQRVRMQARFKTPRAVSYTGNTNMPATKKTLGAGIVTRQQDRTQWSRTVNMDLPSAQQTRTADRKMKVDSSQLSASGYVPTINTELFKRNTLYGKKHRLKNDDKFNNRRMISIDAGNLITNDKQESFHRKKAQETPLNKRVSYGHSYNIDNVELKQNRLFKKEKDVNTNLVALASEHLGTMSKPEYIRTKTTKDTLSDRL